MTAEPTELVPSSAALVRDFVNTEDHELGTDELSSVATFAAWLRDHGLWDDVGRPKARDLELAHALRAGLRRALELNHDGSAGVPPGLREVVQQLPVTLDWDERGPLLAPAGEGARAALAHVGTAALEAMRAGDWPRLKICSSDECAWAYYDQSRNRSRSWCEFGCGNKAKTRAYRARQRSRVG